MGFDVLSPMLYTYNKGTDGQIESVQSQTILGSAVPDRLFKKNTPGMWFTQQSDEVVNKLMAEYKKEPYPSEEEMERIASDVGAPGVMQIKTFFVNMRWKCEAGYAPVSDL